jgi:hypothetical protein
VPLLNLDLRGLADKYARFHTLRSRGSPESVPRSELAALAQAFPGALRALHRMPPEVLAERRESLDAVLTGRGHAQPWMELELAHHGFTRAVLRIRALLEGGPASELPLHAGVLGYRAAPGEPAAERFDRRALALIVDPPHGRLEAWVMTELARDHGVPAADLERVVRPW